MKKFYLLLLLCVAALGLLHAQPNYTVTQSGYNSLSLRLTSAVPTVGTTNYLGVDYATLTIDGFGESLVIGEPTLPVFANMIDMPLCEGMTVKTTNAQYDTIDGAAIGLTQPIMPFQAPRRKSDTSPYTLTKNEATYSTNALYSMDLITTEMVGIARYQNLGVVRFAPVQYNPVTNQIVVCRSVDVTITYINPDIAETERMQEIHYNPAFAAAATMNSLRKDAAYTGAPIKYLIVAGSTFNGQLDSFVNWKKRKGFDIDVVYTSNPNVGTTAASIKSYIHGLYTNATASDPAPTFVLLVGDIAQLPTNSSTVTGTLDSDHPTDLYYFTWTSGDNLPDCYYGRFSVTNASELSSVIEKTLTYEQYGFTDPSFLNKAIMVAGVDGGSNNDNGYKFADPTHDYAITNYINGTAPYAFADIQYYKNNTSRQPENMTNVTISSNGLTTRTSNSAAAPLRTLYNNGAGWINYSAHGNITEWSAPQITNTHVNSMTNTGKYGVMIGNCCLTNQFNNDVCFGEALLRKTKAGAVAYIGGSNYTYWYQDLYWGVGYRSTVANNGTGVGMSMAINNSYPGSYDLMCHTNGQAQNTWHTSLGAMITAGNDAVQTSGASGNYNFPLYYWEIYHLMGDPSITPWLTTPDDMTLNVASSITTGTATLTVNAVPYAYVAMTTGAAGGYALKCATFANASGVATLSLPADLAPGTYEIAASAQQYKTAFTNVTVIVPSGPYVRGTELTEDSPLYVGQGTTYSLGLENIGTTTANNISISFTSDNPLVSVTSGTTTTGAMNASATRTLSNVFSVTADASCTDQMPVTLTATITWEGCTTPAIALLNTVVNAPKPVITYTWNPSSVTPGGSATATVTMTNEGHMAMDNVTMSLTEDFPLVSVTGGPYTFDLGIGASTTKSFTATVGAQMPGNVTLPFNLNVENSSYTYNEVLRLLVTDGGTGDGDNFDDGNLDGWAQGSSYGWEATTTKYHSASYSARSTNYQRNSSTAEMSITKTSTVNDSISFYYVVSSESGYDFFKFYIDGEEQMSASGRNVTAWTRKSFAVPAGQHTYKFTYEKDYNTNSGSDRAWVDDIIFPCSATNLVAARTDQVCQNAAYSLNGQTINTATVGTYYYIETLTGGTGNLVELNVVGSIQSAPITESACGSYTWNGQTYTASGTYTYEGTSVGGCDSVATLNLTINPSRTITFNANGGTGTMAPQNVCSGETVALNANTFTKAYSTFAGWATSATGAVAYANGANVTVNNNMTLYAKWSSNCDNIAVESSATNCGPYSWWGNTYVNSGTYTHTSSNVIGGACDSIYTLHLTIKQNSSSETTETGCSSYVWNGQTYATSGNYTYTTTNAAGCDSTATLHLAINTPKTIQFRANGGTGTMANVTACTGEEVVLPANAFTNTGYYFAGWATSTTGAVVYANGATITVNGNMTLYAKWISYCVDATVTDVQVACDSYSWFGATYSTTGTHTYTHTVENAVAAGCDSIYTLILTINESTSFTIPQTACDSYTWHGTTYTTSGTHSFTSTNAAGCPQVETLNLTINYSATSSEEASGCDSYMWNGNNYTNSGTFIYNSTTTAGCPSVDTLHLTLGHATMSNENATSCDSYTWNANGQAYTTSGTYTATSTNASNCPHTATLHLTINYSTTSSDDATGCDVYEWHGTPYTTGGTYTFSSTNANGCSNTDTLHLTLGHNTTATDNQEACDSYTWSTNGQTYTVSTTDTYTTTNASGCEEVITLHLTIHQSATTSVTGEVAVGETYAENGFYVTGNTEAGTYSYTQELFTENGCDSTVTLTLTVRDGSGIESVNGLKLDIYPNPTTNVSTLTINDANNATIEVYDMYGRKIMSQEVTENKTTIDLTNEASGVYFVRLYQNNMLMGTTKLVRK